MGEYCMQIRMFLSRHYKALGAASADATNVGQPVSFETVRGALPPATVRILSCSGVFCTSYQGQEEPEKPPRDCLGRGQATQGLSTR